MASARTFAGCRVELGELRESNILDVGGWVGVLREEVIEGKGPISTGQRRWVCVHGDLWKRGSTGAKSMR